MYLYPGCFGGNNSSMVVVTFGCADFGCFNQLHFMSVLLAFLYLQFIKNYGKKYLMEKQLNIQQL